MDLLIVVWSVYTLSIYPDHRAIIKILTFILTFKTYKLWKLLKKDFAQHSVNIMN